MDAIESLKLIARDAFFDAIEVSINTFSEHNDEAINEAIHILEQSHIKVCYGVQPQILGKKLNPNDLDESARQAAEDELVRSLDIAKKFGSKEISFLSGKWEPESREESFLQLVKTTINVCKEAAKKRMNVELEVFDYDVDKASLIGPAPLAAQFAQAIRNEVNNFGLLIDLSHIPITHETSRDVIRTCRPYITHLHLGNAVAEPDAEGYGDFHQRLGYPNSANDIAELVDFLQIVKDEGFLNAKNPIVLSMEVQPTKDEDELIIIANTKRCLNRAWSLVE
jgi:sugar phosphate isomerase/epimerase